MFLSRKLTLAELVWQVHDHDWGVIHAAFEEWMAWLVGTNEPALVFLAHANLQYFMKSQKLTPRQACWAAYLTSFWFHILHTPGKANPADPPSRRPDYKQGREAQPLITLLKPAMLKGGVFVGALSASVLTLDLPFFLSVCWSSGADHSVLFFRSNFVSVSCSSSVFF